MYLTIKSENGENWDDDKKNEMVKNYKWKLRKYEYKWKDQINWN